MTEVALVDAPAAPAWSRELARRLVDGGVEVAAWVPDKRLAPLAAELDAIGAEVRTLTREEECVGYAAGFRAAGGTPVVLMQCSGLGNAVNALSSLAVPYGLGFVVVLSMRGTLGERNPAQVPLGRTAVGMLSLLGIQSFSLRSPEDVTAVTDGALALADGAREVSAIVLEPELSLGS